MSGFSRRGAVKSIGGLMVLTLAEGVLAGPRRRRRVRRRVRRHVRRRFRRRVAFRTVGARRLLVVPLAVAVGWELAVAAERAGDPDVVVVVKEVKKTDAGEVLVVSEPSGKVREIEVVREDTAENAKDLPGTELPAGDTSTPAVEADVEEEVEVDE
jgi:hypothetical protein